jgi:hypothetical protein
MDTPIFLAQFWGIVFVLTGITLMINRESVVTLLKLVQEDGMVILLGYGTLMLGVAHILLYNTWTDWTVIITLIGWIILLKGIVRLVAPHYTQRLVKFYNSPHRIRVSLIIMIIIGIFLINQGFQPIRY